MGAAIRLLDGIGFPGGGGLDNPVSITTLVTTINGRLYVGGALMTYNGVNVGNRCV